MKQVTAAIMIDNGRVFVARRHDDDPLGPKWEFPGGKIETGETPEECLRRELHEEFGIDVRVDDFFGESIHKYPGGTIQLLAYHVTHLGGEPVCHVHAECAWVPIAELAKFDFLPADVPLAAKITRRQRSSLSCRRRR